MNDFFIDGFFKAFLNLFGIAKASIIGSSFGAHVATEFAIRFSDIVEKLVLVSSDGMMEKGVIRLTDITWHSGYDYSEML
jgi:pimeloyl-ACP methyl ester carboxylesterase